MKFSTSLKVEPLNKGNFRICISDGNGNTVPLCSLKGSRDYVRYACDSIAQVIGIIGKLPFNIEMDPGLQAEELIPLQVQDQEETASCKQDLDPMGALSEYRKWKFLTRPEAKKLNIEADIRRIKIFLETADLRTLLDLSHVHVQGFMELRLKSIKPSTVHRVMNPVYAFLRWCLKRKYISGDILECTERIKTERKEIEFLTEEEIEVLLQTAQEPTSSTKCRGIEYRDRQRILPVYEMSTTAIYAGLRLSEITHLNACDVNFKKSCIAVTQRKGFSTKTNKNRTIPLNARLAGVLEKYMCEKKISGTDILFPNSKGKITNRSVPRRSLICAVRDAGLPENKANWNVLRHTFASHLVSNGVSIFKVSKWLGHSTVKTTETYYAHLIPDNQDPDIERINIKIETKAEYTD